MEKVVIDVEVGDLLDELSGKLPAPLMEKIAARASCGFNRLQLTFDARTGRIVNAQIKPFTQAYEARVNKAYKARVNGR